MKKTIFVLVIAFLAIGTISAQNWGSPQSVTVEGTLQLQNGQIAIASGNTIYFVPILTQYIGFIEGLREGASISILGYASGNYIEPSRVTINGKSYDFTPNNQGQGGYAYGGHGYGRMNGGYGHHGGMRGYGGHHGGYGRW